MPVQYPAILICAAAIAAAPALPQHRPAAPRETPRVDASAADNEHDDLAVPVLPARRLATPAPEAPPDLPPGADRVQPLTVEVRLTTRAGGRAETRAQTVTRAKDRVHVATATGVEWLFERNPVDPRRVAASAVRHAEKTIVVYSESDLRMALGIPGWAHVLTMGVDARAVTAAGTAEARTLAGLRFHKVRVDSGDRGRTLWWNAEQLLPLEYAAGATGASLAVVKISPGAEPARLWAPEVRFPGYRVVEFADWLEEH